MRVLGVDTASERPDRGYAIADSGALVWFGSEPPGPDAGPIDVVAGERPWQGGKLRGKAFTTFAVNNGFQLRDAWPFEPRAMFILLDVAVWKNLVLPGCARMPGDVFCRNFQAKFAPHCSNHNQLDAMGIALAASRIPANQLKKFVPKGFQR
jgi:hypothetical protein